MPFGSNRLRTKKTLDNRKGKGTRAKNKLLMESLEPRAMLSASLGANSILVNPNVQGTITSLASSGGLTIYSPSQIRAAYGFNKLSQTGAGQTIAIVDAYGDSTLSADLHAFDQQFGLADPKLSIVNETGGTKLPGNNSGWDMEISLDVEWAHAIAPGANILLVEASSASLNDLLTAVNTARNTAGVSVVSMSWGTSDFSGEASYNSYFTTPAGHAPVTFVASSGDSGAGASWPAIANNVLAVGGTTLKLASNGTYSSEAAWSGSGGGYSSNETESSYLSGMQSTGKQSDPDVSYDADPNSGFYVRDGGNWYDVGGTGAGAPQWSALIALANQGRAAAGKATLSNADLSIMSLKSTDFHDITTGSNGQYKATVGYDVVTGRGTPIANLVVADLIAATNPGTTTASVATVSVSKAITQSAEGGGATAVGTSGGESGGYGAAAASTPVGNSTSNVATPSIGASLNSNDTASNLSPTFSTGAKSSLGGDDGLNLGASSADQDKFADLTTEAVSSQFGNDTNVSPSTVFSHDAIENLIDALTSNETA